MIYSMNDASIILEVSFILLLAEDKLNILNETENAAVFSGLKISFDNISKYM